MALGGAVRHTPAGGGRRAATLWLSAGTPTDVFVFGLPFHLKIFFLGLRPDEGDAGGTRLSARYEYSGWCGAAGARGRAPPPQ
ncbi:hypothetical protein EVAR_66345_1 [Eumeta japonica]|uniref:Uncharacterized protein n=1 Tax=Eumeta variegata TaxID=151549 RepID=A0A4C2A139_EUMVA|nr:hypothetical protein EVAR_66345_1 [Eumeta japonica]